MEALAPPRDPPNSSRGQPAPSRARPPSLDRKDLVMTSLEWKVLAQTSLWSALGRLLVTWSSATWPNMALCKSHPYPSLSTLPLPASCSVAYSSE
ncbi:hypothetical protein ANANG_G00031890 [Anguilla anguilla]|uniref:Uncharacterized protein n=1 Tax=Anguilla anguilla TaxID=7936 RepID=A0A9D3MW03_ANGAN|nr:hypothetical protein ANANG_G00031890 [Anguilla anguilla]